MTLLAIVSRTSVGILGKFGRWRENGLNKMQAEGSPHVAY